MQHQKIGIDFLLANTRALLADEAGLGKSRQVLEAAKHRVKGRKLLVICPASIKENWIQEAEKWGFPVSKLVVISLEYDMVYKLKEVSQHRFGAIVVDEAHRFRNWTAQRTKNLAKLLKGRDSCIWFLTGTPMVKGGHDFHFVLSHLKPGKIGKLGEFKKQFAKEIPDKWSPAGVRYEGVKNPRVLSKLLEDVMLRRYKREEIKDLPDKIETDVPVLLDCAKFDIFTDAGLIKAVEKAATRGSSAELPEEYAETIQQLGIKKIDLGIKFCEDILFPHPLVIFAHNRLVIYDIAEKLRDKGRKVHVLIGGMTTLQKQHAVDEFQRGKVDDIVCGIGVGGVGYNMFRASRCVFFQFPWTWADYDQASDRLHRIGQKQCVNIYNLVAKGTFEDRQVKIVRERKVMTAEVVGI